MPVLARAGRGDRGAATRALLACPRGVLFASTGGVHLRAVCTPGGGVLRVTWPVFAHRGAVLAAVFGRCLREQTGWMAANP